jgi:hypothetical protein
MTCLPNIMTTFILVSIAPLNNVRALNADNMSSLSPRPELGTSHNEAPAPHFDGTHMRTSRLPTSVVFTSTTKPDTTHTQPSPTFQVTPATFEHEVIIRDAVDKFTAAGLDLPAVQIMFSDDDRACNGHLGLFESSQQPWRITICSDLAFVPVHELAHAWIKSNINEPTRHRYLQIRNKTGWNSPELDWNERGVEDAAFVIQQNLMANFTGELNEEWNSRATAYEFLTGTTSPLREETSQAHTGAQHDSGDQRPPPISRRGPRPTIEAREGAECAPDHVSPLPPGDTRDVARPTPTTSGAMRWPICTLPQGDPTRPHVLATEVADVVVRIRGGTTCTGTPITGTPLVVTAAHCVLVGDHAPARRTVLRDGVKYNAVAVLVNADYHDSPGPRLDAAVLVMDQVIPGPSATLGDMFPAQESVTLAGFQPLDTDGSLLRGTRHDDRPHPKRATGGVVKIETAAAGCVHLVSELAITSTEVTVPCGLIPGASGGGLFADNNGELILVGVISTVADDLTYNGVTPLASVHELLNNPDQYTHTMTPAASKQSNLLVQW